MFLELIGAGKTIYDTVSGSGGSDGPCPGQIPPGDFDAVRRNAPRHLTDPARNHWNSVASRTRFDQASAAELTKWLSGGGDCEMSDPYGAEIYHDWRNNLVPRYARTMSTQPVPTQPSEPDYWDEVEHPTTTPEPSPGYIAPSASMPSSSSMSWVMIAVALVALWAVTKGA